MSRPSTSNAYKVSLDDIWRRMTLRNDSNFLARRTSVLNPNVKNTLERNNPNSAISKKGSRYGEVEVIEELEGLYERLNTQLFDGELKENKYNDIIRVAHIVTLQVRREVGEKGLIEIDPKEEVNELDYPERMVRQMCRMIVIIETLVDHFVTRDNADEEVGTRIVSHCHDFISRFYEDKISKPEFTLGTLFEEMEKAYTTREDKLVFIRVKRALKFLSISVVIAAIEEIRNGLKLGLEHLTKDIRSSRGWQIVIKLESNVLEIKHIRREAVLKQQGEKNYWEIEYNITSSFDPLMKIFSSVRLALTNLTLGDEMDKQMQIELKQKFFNGKFIFC